MIQVEIHGVFTNARSAYPQVVLKQKDGNAYLPIVIGRFEASAISRAQARQTPARPVCYDLANTILERVQARIVKVEITRLHEGTYYAEIHLRARNGTTSVVDSRPSDAIALALRSGAPIFASPVVMKEAGYIRPEPSGPQDSMEIPDTGTPTLRQNPPPQPTQHAPGKGFLPHALKESPSSDPIEALRRRLEQAVAEEVYEEAARLRDEIIRLEQKSRQ